MSKFWLALKFAMNLYILTAFITLIVLGLVNIIKKFTGQKA